MNAIGVNLMPTLSLSIPDSALRRSPTELAGMNRRDFLHALARESRDVFVLDEDSLARELGLGEPGENAAK